MPNIEPIDENAIGLNWSSEKMIEYMGPRSLWHLIEYDEDKKPFTLQFFPVIFQGVTVHFSYDPNSNGVMPVQFSIPISTNIADPKDKDYMQQLIQYPDKEMFNKFVSYFSSKYRKTSESESKKLHSIDYEFESADRRFRLSFSEDIEDSKDTAIYITIEPIVER